MQGYKVLDGEGKTMNGDICKEGTILNIDGEISYRNRGFHFAEHLEDTLRFCNAFLEPVIIVTVTALGDILSYEDSYYGYYGLHVTNKLRIEHVLTREEIISYALKLDDFALGRFLSLYPLTKDEISLFSSRSFTIQNIIKFYQLGEKDVYKKLYQKV